MSIDRLREIEQEIARLHALQADVLVAVASADRVLDEFVLLDRLTDEERTILIEDAVREEVAAALRWSPSTAHRRIQAARLLAGPLAATKSALAVGDVTPGHVSVIVEAADRLPGRHGRSDDERAAFSEACRSLELRVLPIARRGTLSMTRAAARRAVLCIDAAGEQRRRRAAKCTREIHVWDELDGISTFVARMTTESAHAVMTVIDALAHDHGLVTPLRATMGERRVEAFTRLVLGPTRDREAGESVGAPESRPRLEARLDVVVELPTLLALAAGEGCLSGMAELRGCGPIAAEALRDLLADEDVAVSMRRLVADPLTGHLLDLGRRAYEVSDALRAFLVARDATCRFPGCRRKASRCQVDHAEAWDDGGSTSVDNLGMLCTRHHQLKTHGGWRITESLGDGSCVWKSPAARRYERRVAPVVPAPDPPLVIDVLPDPPPF
jgi:hypothetical protein